MRAETTSNKFEQKVKATANQVFKSFTNATRLRAWLCDGASAIPKSGGRLILWWNDGRYAIGEFKELEKDRKVSFSLTGKEQTAHTTVTAAIQGETGEIQVALVEHGPEIGVSWVDALENLASVLETGLDLRFIRRPMLGIGISDFNETIAAQLGVPVSRGIRIDNVIEGMGAKTAGIQKDDVLVSIGGKEAISWETLQTALQDLKAGDRTEVGLYRGREYIPLQMELSQRPIPEIPDDPIKLTEEIEKKFNEAVNGLESILEGVSDDEASFKPGPDEWSVKETLAHLILGEREFNSWIDGYLRDQVPWTDDWGGNQYERTKALVQAFPALRDLLEQLKRVNMENRAFITNAPDFPTENKHSYRVVGTFLLQSPDHIKEHYDQIRQVVQAARG